MEEQQLSGQESEQVSEQQTEQKRYVPRPTWQIWGARIGLVVFLLFLVLYYLILFAGGGK